ncbi:MAG: hypothetical protein ACPL3C_05595 [Pyrobaculum sp.]
MDFGKKPQEEIIDKDEKRRVEATYQTEADEAAERGSRLLLLSAYRDSKTCPAGREQLAFPLGPKTVLCPIGYWVRRGGLRRQHAEESRGVAGGEVRNNN